MLGYAQSRPSTYHADIWLRMYSTRGYFWYLPLGEAIYIGGSFGLQQWELVSPYPTSRLQAHIMQRLEYWATYIIFITRVLDHDASTGIPKFADIYLQKQGRALLFSFRNHKQTDNVEQNARNPSRESEQNEQQPEPHRVNTKIFPQSTANTKEYSIRTWASECFRFVYHCSNPPARSGNIFINLSAWLLYQISKPNRSHCTLRKSHRNRRARASLSTSVSQSMIDALKRGIKIFPIE